MDRLSSALQRVSPVLVTVASTIIIGKFVKDLIAKRSSDNESNSLKGKNIIRLGQRPTVGAEDITDVKKPFQGSYKLDILCNLVKNEDDKYALAGVQDAIQQAINSALPYKESEAFVTAGYAVLDKYETEKHEHEDVVTHLKSQVKHLDSTFNTLAQPPGIKAFKKYGLHAVTLLKEYQAFAESIKDALKETPVYNKGVNHLYEQRYMPLFAQASGLSMLEQKHPLKQYKFLKDPANIVQSAQSHYNDVQTDITVSKDDLKTLLDEQKKLMGLVALKEKKSDSSDDDTELLVED